MPAKSSPPRAAMMLVVLIAITFCAAGVGAFAMPGAWYASIQKPSWNPPAWIFGPAWTLLYTLMAVAAWMVWKRGGFAAQKGPLTLYFIQLALNAACMTSRRSFITQSALAFTALSASRVLGANERFASPASASVVRGWGMRAAWRRCPAWRSLMLCDPTRRQLDRAKKVFPNAKTTQDLRKVMEDKSIDAVVVSTGNHWHVLAAIWAMQAGKDVYVEKPVSHNIWEGRKLVEAARKYNRIVQGGTQQRSDPLQDEIKAFSTRERSARSSMCAAITTACATPSASGHAASRRRHV
jgi:hypothetical protein